MVALIRTSHPRHLLLRGLVTTLYILENRTHSLTEMVYNWCSVICENYSSLADGEDLLLLSLEIGFRHHYPESCWIEAKLIHTEHHQKLADVVFESRDSEVIADLLYAWTSSSNEHQPYASLGMCAEHLIGLCHLQPFSPRLQLLVIRAVELIGYQAFEQAGVEEFVRLLNSLHVSFWDMEDNVKWARLLLDIIKSSDGIQHLSQMYWELLVELAVLESWQLTDYTYSPYIMELLQDAEEWDKLECWIGIVWVVWPPEGDKTMEQDLQHVTKLLFHNQPSAILKLKQWVERWSRIQYRGVPKSFQSISEQTYIKGAQQDTL